MAKFEVTVENVSFSAKSEIEIEKTGYAACQLAGRHGRKSYLN